MCAQHMSRRDLNALIDAELKCLQILLTKRSVECIIGSISDQLSFNIIDIIINVCSMCNNTYSVDSVCIFLSSVYRSNYCYWYQW